MPVLYKVIAPETKKVSYLFGTVHKSDSQFCLLSQEAKQAFEEAKIVVGEQTFEDFNQFTAQLPAKIAAWREAQLTLGVTDIGDYLSYSQIKQLSSLFDLDKTSFENIKNEFDVPPVWLFHKVTSTLLAKSKANPNSFFENNNGLILDFAIMIRAQETSKKCISLDSIEEKLSTAIGETFSYENQVQYWNECNNGSFDLNQIQANFEANLSAFTKLYLSGDADEFKAHMEKSSADHPMKLKYVKTIIVDQRDKLFSERLEPLLKENKVFACMGFLHLPGVIQHLKDRQFIIEPVIESERKYVINELKNTNEEVLEESQIQYFNRLANNGLITVNSVEDWNSYNTLLRKNKINSDKPIFLSIDNAFASRFSSVTASDCVQIKKLLEESEGKVYGMNLRFTDLPEADLIGLLKALNSKSFNKLALDLRESKLTLPLVKYLNEFVDTYNKDGLLDINIPYVYHPEVNTLRDKVERLSGQYHAASRRY